jgi:hypothetical protein
VLPKLGRWAGLEGDPGGGRPAMGGGWRRAVRRALRDRPRVAAADDGGGA